MQELTEQIEILSKSDVNRIDYEKLKAKAELKILHADRRWKEADKAKKDARDYISDGKKELLDREKHLHAWSASIDKRDQEASQRVADAEEAEEQLQATLKELEIKKTVILCIKGTGVFIALLLIITCISQIVTMLNFSV